MVRFRMARAATILHVDDDPDIRLIVDMALRLDSDLRVRSVASAPEVLAALHGDPVAADALLLDYRIGGTDGLDLLDRVRDIPGAGAIPAIFLTARAMEKDMAAMTAAGATGILTKPFNPLTLAREVRALISGQATP